MAPRRQRLLRSAASKVEAAVDAIEAKLALREIDPDAWRNAAEEGFEELVKRLVEELTKQIERVASAGPKVGDPVVAQWVREHAEELAQRIVPQIRANMTRSVLVGGMNEIAQAAREGAGVVEAAYRMRDVAGYEPAVAQARVVVQAMRRAVAAATGGRGMTPDAARALARVRRYADTALRRLEGAESYGVRGATLAAVRQMEEAAERGRADLVAEAVRWRLYHKAAYHARMTARTELARASTQATVDTSRAMGFDRVRYVLNKVRHEPDECDEAAAGSSAGEQPGVYRLDDPARPDPPLHPNCMCYLDYVVEG